MRIVFHVCRDCYLDIMLMRTILTLLFLYAAAQTALAADVVTNFDIRSAQARLVPGQHKTVGWMNKLGTNFDGALNAKLAENGFTVGNIVYSDYKFLITTAQVTLRRSGRVRSVKLAELDRDIDFVVPAYKPRTGAVPEVSQGSAQINPTAGADAVGAVAVSGGNPAVAAVAAITVGASALINGAIEALVDGSTEEGGEGLLQVHLQASAEKGSKRLDIVVSVMPKSDQPVGVLFHAVAEAIVQALVRGDEVAGGKFAPTQTAEAGS